MAQPVVLTRDVDVRADPAAVWKLITDTDRMNKMAGLPPVEVEPLAEKDAQVGSARHLIKIHFFGMELAYEERPFEWVEGERFSILRTMRSGPLRSLEMIFALEPGPKGTGTRVKLRLTLQPSSKLMSPVASVVGGRALKGFERALHRVDKRISTGRWDTKALERRLLARDAMSRSSDDLRKRLDRHADIVEKLVDHISTGEDVDVSRIRPFELADRWECERNVVLATCLHAVHSGLLELRWDLVCPSCRTASDQVLSLGELTPEGHCQLCDLSFGLELDRLVEATFVPSPTVRRVEARTYCIGGPARTPHVVSQVILTPGEEGLLKVPTESGRYRVFVRGGSSGTVEVGPEAPARAKITIGGEFLEPCQVEVAPAGTLVLAVPETAGECHAKLERLVWASNAATAHHVSTFPDFRRLFSQQVLHPDLALKVGRVAILFSDLTGSTQLYTDVGDAEAFRLVQDHFVLLRGVIAEHEGTIVKTIGDAVMAAFQDEAQAVRAAVAMLQAFPDFARDEGHPDVTLKLGLYAAACYAVTANNQLDYFGQAVNLAARLQGQAQGGELVLTEQLAALAEQAGWLDEARIEERFPAELKGLAAPVPAVRIRVS